jgi:hypothetical protein
MHSPGKPNFESAASLLDDSGKTAQRNVSVLFAKFTPFICPESSLFIWLYANGISNVVKANAIAIRFFSYLKRFKK